MDRSTLAPRYVLYASPYLAGKHSSIRWITNHHHWSADRLKRPHTTEGGATFEVYFQVAHFRSFYPPMPFDALLALDSAASNREHLVKERAFMAQAQAVVFVVDPFRVGQNEDLVELLGRDLEGAGRDPRSVPVVFQINKQDALREGEAPALSARSLSWPRAAFVESTASAGEGVREALDRALAMIDEEARP